MTPNEYQQWLDENNLTIQEGGYVLGVGKTQSYNIHNGTRIIGKQIQRAIMVFNFLPAPKRKALIRVLRKEIKDSKNK